VQVAIALAPGAQDAGNIARDRRLFGENRNRGTAAIVRRWSLLVRRVSSSRF
jgi:hypothetical protein